MGFTYLIGEMIALLAIASVIGFVVGWGFRRLLGGNDSGREQELSMKLGRIEAERNELQSRLGRMQGAADGSAVAAAKMSGNPLDILAASPSPISGENGRLESRPRGEYRVADLPGVGDQSLHMLRDLGIRTTYDLLRESDGESKLRLLSTALEQDVDQVRSWRAMADLLRVPGVDGPHACLLVNSGVVSVDSLYGHRVDDLRQQLERENAKLELVQVIANHATVESWINYASPMSQMDLDS